MRIPTLLFIVSIWAVSQQQTIKQVRNQWRQSVAPYMSSCLCQTKVDPGLVEEFFEFGYIPDDPCFKCFVKCWGKATGVLASSGNLNFTVYRNFFGISEDVAFKCINNDDVDLCQKAYEFLACTYNTLSLRLANPSPSLTYLPVSHEKP